MGSIRAIGIDFGTSNSAASALLDDGTTRLLELDPQASDPRLIKTLLYFPNRKEAFFGQEAIAQYFDRDREGRFFQSIKRLLPNPEFQGTAVHGQFSSIEELVSRFLKETRARIEKAVGAPLAGVPVVMGRPARYSLEPDREALGAKRFRAACDLAGFEGCRLQEEPLAAARTYKPSNPGTEELVLVVDLGGGTSDFTLMSFGPKGPEVLATYGVPVAGDALDSAFVQERLTPLFGSEIQYQRPFSSNVLTMPTAFMRLLPKWHHHAFLKEKSAWNFLKNLHHELVDKKDKTYLENLITLVEDNLGYALHQKVELLKVRLSSSTETVFEFRSHPIRIEMPVKQGDYEALIMPSVREIFEASLETMRQGRREPNEVHTLYFTGGTSQVPMIRQGLLAQFPKARVAEQDTFTSVASGLALAAVHSGK